jgi:hypothetical protein
MCRVDDIVIATYDLLLTPALPIIATMLLSEQSVEVSLPCGLEGLPLLADPDGALTARVQTIQGYPRKCCFTEGLVRIRVAPFKSKSRACRSPLADTSIRSESMVS